MATITTRPFAYNPTQASISGTTNVGNICIGVSAQDYGAKPGNLTWWMGPVEDSSYVICKDVPAQNFPTQVPPTFNVGGVQFWRCANNDAEFTNLVQTISGTSQVSASAASTWLYTNGYWTNYDAQAFIAIAGITDTTQKTAIDALVAGLKADSLWSKMVAIYPFVGGNPTSCKYNLKDPRDSDAAFRLNFVNGWTITNDGVKPNGLDTYANTYIVPATHLSAGNVLGSSLSHYSRTTSVDSGTPYGTKAGGYNSQINLALNTTSVNSGIYHNSNSIGVNPSPLPTTTAVNLIHSRVNTSQVVVAVNANANTYLQTESALSTAPIYLGARNLNNATIPDLFYSRQMAFAHIGDGLTLAQCILLNSRIQAFQTTLNRANP